MRVSAPARNAAHSARESYRTQPRRLYRNTARGHPMDMKLYPAIFQPQPLGGYAVRFYDIPGCMAKGDDTGEATQNARDALGRVLSIWEAAGRHLPEPTPLSRIQPEKGAFCVMVTVDMDEYRGKPGQSAQREYVWPAAAKTTRSYDRKN